MAVGDGLPDDHGILGRDALAPYDVVLQGDQHRRPVLDEVLDEVPSDLSHAGDADPAAAQRRRPPQVLGGGAACGIHGRAAVSGG